MTDRHKFHQRTPRCWWCRRPWAQTMINRSNAVAERLDTAAGDRGVARSWLADRLLAEALDRLVPPENFRLTRD